MRRHDDLLRGSEKSGRHGVVVGGAALKEDAVADLALTHQAVQVVVGDRIGETGDQVLAFGAARLVAHHVALHEHRAALSQADGRRGLQRELGELADDLDAELLGLLFENEPVPAAQASFMAKSTTMPSCMEMNLESDRRSRRWCRPGGRCSADEVGAGLVGGDLVGDQVGAAELADELAARAGGAHTEHRMRSPISSRISVRPAPTTSTGRACVLV